MRLRKRIAGVFLGWVFLCGLPFVCEAKKADTQYWKGEYINWKIAKAWTLTLEEETYWKDDASDYYYQHTEFGALFSGLASWLDVGASFRHVLQENKSAWTREERPNLIATLKAKPFGWSVNDRNKFEYRIREDADDFWRYRNNLTIKPPWKLTSWAIQPYLSEEFFVDFDKREINENRLSQGVSLPLNKTTSVEVYYMWRRVQSSDQWTSSNVVGTKLKLSF